MSCFFQTYPVELTYYQIITDKCLAPLNPTFSHIVEMMKERHNLRIRRWRRTMSGCAWRVFYDDGRTVNFVESPYPKTPISLAVFLHEVGHHAIGFNTYRQRCEEEYHAWMWAINQMRKFGIEPDERVWRRFKLSMQYAVGKALRRGIKNLPHDLHEFVPKAA